MKPRESILAMEVDLPDFVGQCQQLVKQTLGSTSFSTIVVIKNTCSYLGWRVDRELSQSLSSTRRVSQRSGC